MYEDVPLIHMNIRILRFFSLLYAKNIRRFIVLFNGTFLCFCILNWMLQTDEGIVAIIGNAYVFVLWLNTVIRAYLLVLQRGKYERLIDDLVSFYYELKSSKDNYVRSLITVVDREGHRLAKGNFTLGIITCFGLTLFPLFSNGRVLPYSCRIPSVNELETPVYEVLYVYEMVITPTGCSMYIPYTSLVVQFIMFGIVMCKTLQHRLRGLNLLYRRGTATTTEDLRTNVIACIKYQERISSYIDRVNGLIAFVFLFEFLAFGALLCALLFLLIIVDSTAQIVIVCAYINMIFAQILALYWFANELREQSLGIALAAYETDWFTFPVDVQKLLLFMIMRAQKPNSIQLGYIFPITLQLFQKLLNVSYSYFTLFKRVYG